MPYRSAPQKNRHNLLKRAIGCSLLVLASGSGHLVAQGHAGQYAQADIQYGSAIYADQCAQCHGPNGDQIGGINLRSGQLRRGGTDDELRGILTNGIPGTGMPAFKFDASELTGIIAYLRNMRDFEAKAVVVGDTGRGRALFEGKGACATCHRVNGAGSRTGPNLSQIGSVRPAGALEQSLLDPNGSMLPLNRSVRAVTKDGKVITGRRLNEDTYTVVLIDQQERLVSLMKPDLQEYTVLKTSPMPSYTDRLTSGELADVLAYLLSLKGPKS
jgi:putative heme-binding domain-containing protein